MAENRKVHHPEPDHEGQGGQFRPSDSGNEESPERQGSAGHHGPDERHYTLSIDEPARKESFEIEDRRWSRSQQIGDWLKLALIVVIYLAVTFVVYLFQPGLR